MKDAIRAAAAQPARSGACIAGRARRALRSMALGLLLAMSALSPGLAPTAQASDHAAGIVARSLEDIDYADVRDALAEEFGVNYPSIMDNAGERKAQRAFAGQVPLNAVPTTLVLDREGRVAHRVVGQLAAASQLRTLVQETLDEA